MHQSGGESLPGRQLDTEGRGFVAQNRDESNDTDQ
jgi:hypothetical protein